MAKQIKPHNALRFAIAYAKSAIAKIESELRMERSM
jgi:hypothetical protein